MPASETRPCARSMRMYGRENSAVVSATNAVSATRNTFSESMKKLLVERGERSFLDYAGHEAHRGAEGDERETRVYLGGVAPVPHQREHGGLGQGREDEQQLRAHHGSFSRSRWRVHRVEAAADLEQEHAEDQRRHQHVDRRCRARPPSACRRPRRSRRRTGHFPSPGTRPPAAPPWSA